MRICVRIVMAPVLYSRHDCMVIAFDFQRIVDHADCTGATTSGRRSLQTRNAGGGLWFPRPVLRFVGARPRGFTSTSGVVLHRTDDPNLDFHNLLLELEQGAPDGQNLFHKAIVSGRSAVSSSGDRDRD